MLGGVRARSQADRAVQVGHDDRRDQADSGDRHEEGDEHLNGGQHEHEEGDVQSKLRVNLPKGGSVEELQERLPFGGQAGAVGEAKEESDAPEGEATHGFEGLLVSAQGGRGLAPRRGGAVTVGEGHREVDESGRHDQANDEEADMRTPLGEDDASGAHLAEPQDLGPHDGSRIDDGSDDQQRCDRDAGGARLAYLELRARTIGVSRSTRSTRGKD